MHVLAIATSLVLYLCMLHRVVHSIATGYAAMLGPANYSSCSIKVNKQDVCKNLEFEKGSRDHNKKYGIK